MYKHALAEKQAEAGYRILFLVLGTKFLTRYLINNEYLRKGGRGNKNYFIGALSGGGGGNISAPNPFIRLCGINLVVPT